MSLREDRGRRLAAKLLDGEPRVLARAQDRLALLDERADERTQLVQRTARAAATCSSNANGSSAPSSSSRPSTTNDAEDEAAEERVEMRRAHGHDSRYAPGAASPPLRTEHCAARAGEETRLDEQLHDVRLDDGLAVEALDREALRAAAPHVRDERSERRPSHSGSGSRSGTSERPPRSTKSAASPSSSTTHAPATRAARAPERRGQGSAAPYGCAGSAAASTSASRVRRRSGRAAARAVARRRPESANCAPPSPSTKYPRRQTPSVSSARSSRVDGAVSAADPLAAHAVARDDPLSLEQELGERAAGPARRAKSGAASDHRPCVGDGDRRARAREPPRPPLGPR